MAEDCPKVLYGHDQTDTGQGWRRPRCCCKGEQVKGLSLCILSRATYPLAASYFAFVCFVFFFCRIVLSFFVLVFKKLRVRKKTNLSFFSWFLFTFSHTSERRRRAFSDSARVWSRASLASRSRYSQDIHKILARSWKIFTRYSQDLGRYSQDSRKILKIFTRYSQDTHMMLKTYFYNPAKIRDSERVFSTSSQRKVWV